MNNKQLIISFIAIMFSSQIFSQKRVMLYIDYGFMFGLQEKFDDFTLSRNDYKMSGNSLHLTALYPLSENISVGAGMGLDRYEHPGYNTMPFFATAHISPIKTNHDIYAFSNIGYSIGGNTFAKGAMWDIGIGYKWMIKPKFGITFKLGYNLKSTTATNSSDIASDTSIAEFEIQNIDNINHTRHSIIIGTGIIF